jgi:hypothetical protein
MVAAQQLTGATGNEVAFAGYLMALSAISIVLALGAADRAGQPLPAWTGPSAQ